MNGMRQLGSLSRLTSLLSVMFSGFIHVVAGTHLGTFPDPVSLFRLDPRDTCGAGGLEVAEASTLGSEAKVRLALGAVLVLRVSPSLPNSPFLGWGMEEAETVPLGLSLVNPASVLASVPRPDLGLDSRSGSGSWARSDACPPRRRRDRTRAAPRSRITALCLFLPSTAGRSPGAQLEADGWPWWRLADALGPPSGRFGGRGGALCSCAL